MSDEQLRSVPEWQLNMARELAPSQRAFFKKREKGGKMDERQKRQRESKGKVGS